MQQTWLQFEDCVLEWRTQKVDALLADVTKSLDNGDIALGIQKVREALGVHQASSLAKARKLDQQIRDATDPARIQATLVDLPDDAFQRLVERSEMPKELVSDFAGMDKLTAELARGLLETAVQAREVRRREQLERERIAKEEAQRANEARQARALAADEDKRKEDRKKQIKGFSVWDGSHYELTKRIKDSMNDPDSFTHVETVYWDNGDHLIVRTTFRGKNAFGGVVKNWVKAKVDLNGNVLAIIEQGP